MAGNLHQHNFSNILGRDRKQISTNIFFGNVLKVHIVPYLNEYVGLGQIERGVGHLGHKDGADLGVVLEVLNDADPLGLGGGAVDERPFELLGIVLQGKDIVAVG